VSKDYSYADYLELGIEVCASCGGANINYNYNIEPGEYCKDCEHSEGTNTCMPDNEYFYQLAKQQMKKIKGDQ